MLPSRLKKKAEMDEIVETTNSFSIGQLQFKKELPELSTIPQCVLKQTVKDYMNFTGVYTPDNDSLWYGGNYEFSIGVTDDYPFNPPKVVCLTKIYHPNIDTEGHVCLNILKEEWSPILNISTVIAGLYFLFTDPNPNDPLNLDAASIMRDNPDQFALNVKKTLKGGKMFNSEFAKFP